MSAQVKISGAIFAVLFFGYLFLTAQQQPQKVEDLISLIKEKSGLEVGLEDIGWQWRDEDTI